MRARLAHYVHSATSPSRTNLTWFDLVEIGLVAFGFLLYFLVRGGVVDRTGDALMHARWIIDVQQSVGVFIEPLVNQWTLDAEWRIRVFNAVYFWMDFPLIVAIGLYWFWRARHYYTLLRDSLLLSGAIALVLYWTFPVAPPRYLPEWGFVDTLERFANLSYQAQSMETFVNPFAAVPSLHVGWTLLLAIVIFEYTRNPWWRILGLSVPTLQIMAVVATANHYLFDALLGVVVALVGLALAIWLQRTGYPGIRRWLHRQSTRGRAGIPSEPGEPPEVARV
jgi:hypothetical protein